MMPAATPGKTPFERAMRQLGNPDVGADPQGGGNDEAAVAARIAKYAYA